MFYEKSVSFYILAKKPFLISHLFFYVQRQPRIPLLAGIGIGAKKVCLGEGATGPWLATTTLKHHLR